MGLDVFFTKDGQNVTIDHVVDFPMLCGFHLWRDLDVVRTRPAFDEYGKWLGHQEQYQIAPTNVFGMEPGMFDGLFSLPYSWYRSMTPEELGKQRDALCSWVSDYIPQGCGEDVVVEGNIPVLMVRSLLAALDYAVERGYGTCASN